MTIDGGNVSFYGNPVRYELFLYVITLFYLIMTSYVSAQYLTKNFLYFVYQLTVALCSYEYFTITMLPCSNKFFGKSSSLVNGEFSFGMQRSVGNLDK